MIDGPRRPLLTRWVLVWGAIGLAILIATSHYTINDKVHHIPLLIRAAVAAFVISWASPMLWRVLTIGVKVVLAVVAAAAIVAFLVLAIAGGHTGNQPRTTAHAQHAATSRAHQPHRAKNRHG